MSRNAGKADKHRRDSSLFAAEAAYADSIFRDAMGDLEGSRTSLERAIEIKPDYAPAILSMGSVHYQLGKRDQGQRLFVSLLSLPESTPDLCEILDKAGSFLIQFHEYEDGLFLYQAAVDRFPNVAILHQGIGCCAGHQGLYAEAVASSERALKLEPNNQGFMNDLGWSLFQAERLTEARQLLERAVSMDPSDDLARENLRICVEAISESST